MEDSLTRDRSNHATLGLLLCSMLFLAACAHVVDVDPCREGPTYGLLGGLWHGFICPASFFISLILDDVSIYAVNNNGGWYDFGFVLGSGILFGGGSRAARRR